jgi:hypothetical protein
MRDLLVKHTILCAAIILALPGFALAQVEETEATASDISAVPAVVDERVLPATYRLEPLPNEDVYGDFVVGPGKVEVELSPGTSRVVTLSVSNRTGEPRRFEITVEDAEGTQDPNTPVQLLGEDVGPYTLKDYVSIPDRTFILDHGQKVHIPVTVNLPANAEPGGRYGSVLVSTFAVERPATDASVPRSAIISRIGTLFFVTTPGLETREGSLVDFTTAPVRSLYATGPITFGIYFENTGNVHLNPYGEVRIKNMLGEEVGVLELDPWFAMPESLRLREVTWDRAWLFGRYVAEAQINRGYGNIVDTRTYTFWVINWYVLGGGLLAVTIFLLLVRFITSRFEFRRKR